MPEAYNRSTELIIKYLHDELNEEEKNELDQLLADSVELRELFDQLHEPGWLLDEVKIFYEPDVDAEREKVLHIIKRRQVVRRWRWAAAAAVLIIGMGTIGYYWLMQPMHKSSAVPETAAKAPVTDLPPGGDTAELILADNSTISLDQTKTGKIAEQGNTVILNQENGLHYQTGSLSASKEVLYNTLVTPAGGIYMVELPDGTKAWLNAASSLRYPTVFTGSERLVEITGEVYFEVAKVTSGNRQPVPFKVRKGNILVQVLGTHFNFNAYDDEDTLRTTVLEGAVKIFKGSASVVVHSGQQARIVNTDMDPGGSNEITVLGNIDTTKEVAWKDGFFKFKKDNIKTAMRQIQRWYKVKVEYNFNYNKVQERINGLVPRNNNLSQALSILLDDTNIMFNIDSVKRKVTLIF